MNQESIPVEVYEQRYFKTFDPDLTIRALGEGGVPA